MYTFILSTWEDAHQQARLTSLEKILGPAFILTYRRPSYKTEIDRDVVVIGILENSRYVRRFFTYMKALKLLKRAVGKSNVMYVFGFDNLLLTWLARALNPGRCRIVYEVPDIREVFFREGMIGGLFRSLDRFLLGKIDVLISTSDGFIDYYRAKVEKLPKIFLLENKVHLDIDDKHVKHKQLAKCPDVDSNIRVGYFGLLRCVRTLDIMIKLAQRESKLTIILRGIFMKHTEEYRNLIEEISNIHYLGPYISPFHLEEMYNDIDISWIAYPYSKEDIGNWKLARTNRYYEAGYFSCPMIALRGTRDAARVEENDFGIVLKMDAVDSAVAQLAEELTITNLNKWKSNIGNASKTWFQITDEYQNLSKLIKTTCSK